MTDHATTDLKQSPLAPLLKDSGARFMGLCGWETPAHFGDPEGEYNAATSAVALFDAGFLTKVLAKGSDHIDYLNRRLSQRLLETDPGSVLRANQLSADGRMDADMEVLRTGGEESLLLAPPAVAGDYLQALSDKYVFSEDATFTDVTADWASICLIGPKADQTLELVNLPNPASGEVLEIDLSGAKGWITRSEFLFGSILLLLPTANAAGIWQTLLTHVGNLEGRPIGFLPFDTLRVEHGAPWWGIDLTDRSIPLEADLMSAIHTNKGCYPGQETIAKILNLGHPARKMVGVSLQGEDPPAAGTPLVVDGKDAGHLTSSTWSPRLGHPIGLAMVKWPYRQPGTKISTPEGVEGSVVTLPFS